MPWSTRLVLYRRATPCVPVVEASAATATAPLLAPALARAWELCYLDPLAARDLARDLACEAAQSVATATEGWLLVALCEVRVGRADVAQEALAHARRGYANTTDVAAQTRGGAEVRL